MRLLITTLLTLLSISLYGQSYTGSGNYNRIGLQGRYSLLNIETSDLSVEGREGFQAGLTTRGRLYNNFGVVYGIDFISSKAEVMSRAIGETQEEAVSYDIIGAQLNLLLSYNILEQNLSLEVGPALLVNSKMKIKNQGQETNIVSGYTSLTAADVQEITRVNPFGVIALTGGFESVRFTVQYQYGFSNFFGNFQNQDLQEIDLNAKNFKATASFISGGIIIYL